MDIRIEPSAPSGTVKAPPAKSAAHRLLICAGLADGVSVIRGISPSQDVLATADCLEALGATVQRGGDPAAAEQDWTVIGTDPAQAGSAVLRCRESGSTLRFFIPLAAMSESAMTLTGTEKLLSRPLSIYRDIFAGQSLPFETSLSEVCVTGRLSPGEYVMDGSISSQFISGMLYALPLLGRDSVIRLIPPVESRGYIDMTIEALTAFGVEAAWENDMTIRIPGGQRYRARDIRAEGDWSNAAFFIAMGLEVSGLKDSSLQPDRVCREYFKAIDEGCAELDISGCPDLGPILMAYAAMKRGCTLTGTKRLRIKESDRGSAMKEELDKFGVRTEIEENRITIASPEHGLMPPHGVLCGHNDHRIVMSLAVMCTVTGGTIIGAEAVNKSFPDFFTRLRAAGVELSEVTP